MFYVNDIICFNRVLKLKTFRKEYPRWLSRKFHIQGAVVFQRRGNTCKYAEFLKNRCNAVDGTFYDAIKFHPPECKSTQSFFVRMSCNS